MTQREELAILGKAMFTYMPPKMQRVFLQKITHTVGVDYADPAIYVKVDENNYLQKITSPRESDQPNTTLSSPK